MMIEPFGGPPSAEPDVAADRTFAAIICLWPNDAAAGPATEALGKRIG